MLGRSLKGEKKVVYQHQVPRKVSMGEKSPGQMLLLNFPGKFGNCEWGGSRKGVFKKLNVLRFLCVDICYCKGILKIDTSLAIATSGLRTKLLFENPPPSENPPFGFPRKITWTKGTEQKKTKRPPTGTGTKIQFLSLVAHDCGYPLSRYTCRATRVRS